MNSHVLKSPHAVALPAPASGNAPDWIQVFPSGTFSGRDGRGPYTCDPAAVVARTREHNGPVDIPVDYDHQLEHTAMNGRPAIAAGWITELEARADGVWGRVEWTDKGKAHVAAREYRYVSPVYYYQQDTGDIQAIESVALTNVPNLTGLKALAAREPGLNLFTGDITMSFLKTMASVLGITDVEPTEAAVETAARRVMADVGAMKSAMSVMAEAAKTDDKTPGGIAKAVQSIAARAEHPDVSKYVPVETFNTVNAELSRMKAGSRWRLWNRARPKAKSVRRLRVGPRELPQALLKPSRNSWRWPLISAPAAGRRRLSRLRPRKAPAPALTPRQRLFAGQWAFPRMITKRHRL